MKFLTFLTLCSAFILFLVGCSSNEIVKQRSAEEHFTKGKQLFDNEDYLEAIDEFKTVGLQYTGSSYADDAQYYLGECYFKRGEFLLAAYEYETLKKRMASSPLVPLASYKLALSYYELSPKATLDQKYTSKAIDELQAFLEYYPTHDSAKTASEKIQQLNNRLAKKEYDTAELYMTLEEYQAAQHYFEKVLERFHDSRYAELSQLGIVESWMSREKYDKAKTAVDEFFVKYPAGAQKEKAESMKRDIEKEILEHQSIPSVQPENQ